MTDLLMVSPSFMRVYAEEAEAHEEHVRLALNYDVFGPNRLDWRKRKRLLRKARERGAKKFYARFGQPV